MEKRLDRGPWTATDGNMRHVGRLTGLKVLHLEMTDIGDAGLKQVRGMKSLERLYLPNGLTDAGLVHVGQVQSLKALHFGGNRATDAGLVHVAKLANLEELSLGGTYLDKKGKVLPSQITDAGLVQLTRLPRLRYLALFGDFTDAGLVHLKNLPSLRNLNLAHLKITDAGAVHLKEIKTLEHLSLPPMGLTDVGFASLAELDRLKYLWVGTSGLSKITDAGLRHIEGLTGLSRLTINSGKSLSPAAVARLRKALPNANPFNVDKNRAVPSTQTAAKALKVGDAAPAFSVETIDGKEIKLADYQGKAVLLYFWATWCSPCVASTPNLKEFEAALSKEHKDFAMISLSMDDGEVLVQDFVKKHDLGWTQTRIGMNSKVASTDKDWNNLESAVAESLRKSP